MRLLVVEDEADLAHALAKGLRQQGYAVDLAFDGMRGLELAEINDYDLLILDLNLPEQARQESEQEAAQSQRDPIQVEFC